MHKEKDFIDLEVIGWRESQAPKTNPYKTLSRTGIDTHIFSDSKFIRISANAKLIYFYLFLECGKKNSASITVSLKIMQTNIQHPYNIGYRFILELEQFQLVKISHGTLECRLIEENREPSAPKAKKAHLTHNNIENNIEQKMNKELGSILKFLENKEENFAKENINF